MDRTIRFPTDLATALVVALLVLLPAPRSAWADVVVSGDAGQEPSTRDSVSRYAAELTPAMVEAEIERRFNDLRTDVLATQASAVQWWMRMMAMVLTFFGIAVPVLGFLGFSRFREIERDTRHNARAVVQAAESAKRYLQDMETVRSDVVSRGRERQELHGDKLETLAGPVVAGAFAAARTATGYPGRPPDAVDPMTSLSRGAAKADMGRHEEAIADYDEAIRLSGGVDGVAYYNRGASCLALARYQEAIADYDAAIRLDSMDPGAFAMRGLARAELGQTDEAIADYNEAIRMQPNDVFSLLNRGRAWWEAGKHDEAIADFDRAITLEPDDGGTMLARGIVKREAGMRDEARQDLQSALTLAQAAGDGVLADKVRKFLGGSQA